MRIFEVAIIGVIANNANPRGNNANNKNRARCPVFVRMKKQW
jgi:hypothetical protein